MKDTTVDLDLKFHRQKKWNEYFYLKQEQHGSLVTFGAV